MSLTNIMSSFSFISDSIFSSVVLFALLILKLLTLWLLNVTSGKVLIGLLPSLLFPILFSLFSFVILPLLD